MTYLVKQNLTISLKWVETGNILMFFFLTNTHTFIFSYFLLIRCTNNWLFTLSGLHPQVRILRLLRILGRNNETASDAMNDLLAQVQYSLYTNN